MFNKQFTPSLKQFIERERFLLKLLCCSCVVLMSRLCTCHKDALTYSNTYRWHTDCMRLNAELKVSVIGSEMREKAPLRKPL